jgi:hypothetical protein
MPKVEVEEVSEKTGGAESKGEVVDGVDVLIEGRTEGEKV